MSSDIETMRSIFDSRTTGSDYATQADRKRFYIALDRTEATLRLFLRLDGHARGCVVRKLPGFELEDESACIALRAALGGVAPDHP